MKKNLQNRLSKSDEWRLELETLLARPSPQFRSWYVPEPQLLFCGGQPGPDPKSGIALFGPFGQADGSELRDLRVALIGTGSEIQAASAWVERCNSRIHGSAEFDPFLFPAFPGMATSDGFRCTLRITKSEQFSDLEIRACTTASSRDLSVESVARIVGAKLENLRDSDSPVDVALICLSEEIRRIAGGGRTPAKRAGKRLSPQLSFFDEKRDEPDSISRTLHRAIKAEGMRSGIPTQLAWPSTFAGGEDVQDDATRAWNMCTALYYKARGVPWRVQGLDKETCYVGISFYRPLGQASVLQSSMAQAFSERGEGFVLRGGTFEWDSKKGPPHLDRQAAAALLGGVLGQYRRHHARLPARVVIHKSSRFARDEIKGFDEALGDGVPYSDFVGLTKSSIRFLRVGNEPPLRGTAIQIAPLRHIVYTRGFVPFLGLYPGAHIPRPFDIHHARGSTAISTLLREILALSRMNWNSADFAAAEPITLGFARKIGLILSELPRDVEPQSSFRFYM